MSTNDQALTDNREEESEDRLGVKVKQGGERPYEDETAKPAHTSDDPYKTRS